MANIDHKIYAEILLTSLTDLRPDFGDLNFQSDPTQSRNAAKAMTAILCNRLYKTTGNLPNRKENTNFEWQGGIFNCRNIADRDYLWTNMLRSVANKIHEIASQKPAAYLLAFANPSDTNLNVWAIPESLLFDCLSKMTPKKGGSEYTVQISTKRQVIEHYKDSPDLLPYFQEFRLSKEELDILNSARKVDHLKKLERKAIVELETIALEIEDNQGFNPSDIDDARYRVQSSIVRRMGQSSFRQKLLSAYESQCMISGCNVEHVLDAAHIVPYQGPDTNHPANGLLLRTDLHTLFDLKLLAIDADTRCVLISPILKGTSYQKYHGKQIRCSVEQSIQISDLALKMHRDECEF